MKKNAWNEVMYNILLVCCSLNGPTATQCGRSSVVHNEIHNWVWVCLFVLLVSTHYDRGIAVVTQLIRQPFKPSSIVQEECMGVPFPQDVRPDSVNVYVCPVSRQSTDSPHPG